MPKYAYFNSADTPPVPVTGWFNTEMFHHYNPMPADADLLQITEGQWETRLEGLWAVDNGELVPYTPPVPEPTADEVLAEKIAAGITLNSPSNPSIDGIWALDATTLAELGAVARDFAAGLGLPQDASTFDYPNQAGALVTLSGFDVMNVYKSQRDMVDTLTRQAAIMRGGGTPDWPLQADSIP